MLLTAMSKKLEPARPFGNDFERFAAEYLKIQDVRMQTIPLQLKPLQRRFLAERTGRDIIVKSRHIGFTTVTMADLLYSAFFEPAATLALGKDQENLDRIRLMWQVYYDNLPPDLQPRRRLDNKALVTLPEVGSFMVMAKAGSRGAGRSFSFIKVLLDEAAYYGVPLSSVLTAISNSGTPRHIAVGSSPNGATGDFYEMAMRALKGVGIWKLHFFPWWDDPDYRLPLDRGEVIEPDEEELALIRSHGLDLEQIKWRRYKIAEAPSKSDFLQEFPEDVIECFKLSGEGYYGNIDRSFIEPPETEPNPDDIYVAGADWGQHNDYTTTSIRNKRTGNQVAALRINRTSFKAMRGQMLDLCQAWNVRLLRPESNNAGSNVEDLRAERYDGLRVVPFKMTHASKVRIFGNHRDALRLGTARWLNDPVQRAESRAAISKQTPDGSWTIYSPRDKDGHGDMLVADAIALEACTGFVDWDTDREVAHD
jgi:hypothetical protein